MTGIHTKQDCIDAYNKLATAGVVTRDRYRKDSGISEPVWEYHFGTFAELKRQAAGGTGIEPTRADKKLLAQVAKHTELKGRKELDEGRKTYADKYLRVDSQRYKTMVVASDLHDKEVDPFWLRVFLDTCARVQPDVVALGGDVFDLPEFGRFTVDPREWDAVGRIRFVHEQILAPLRSAAPDAQIDLIEGNHECVTPETEILTSNGWVMADKITRLHNIVSFDKVTHMLRPALPIMVSSQEGRIVYEVETFYKKERITGNHRIAYQGTFTALEDIERLDGRAMLNAIEAAGITVGVDPNVVGLATWLMAWGSIQVDIEGAYWLRFAHLNGTQLKRLKAIVTKLPGIKWLPVQTGLDVRGVGVQELLERITGISKFAPNTRWRGIPEFFHQLDVTQARAVARDLTLCGTTGWFAPNTSYYNGYNHDLGEDLQWFFATHGVPCAITLLSNNTYNLKFSPTSKMEWLRGGKVSKRELEDHRVISIQTIDGTLITRLDGKINFTGNCRLVKHLADFSPATRAILGDLHGMTLGSLFGLDKYKVNYVAQTDLKSFTERDHKRELEKNYKVYWDAVVVHHFPYGRNLGLPGVNGHHHSHVVWAMHNHHVGAYEWHQLGAGHKRVASYCNGEKWHNGFAIIHVDTLTKGVNIEYVPVTNMAVVGGKYYHRAAHEMVLSPK